MRVPPTSRRTLTRAAFCAVAVGHLAARPLAAQSPAPVDPFRAAVRRAELALADVRTGGSAAASAARLDTLRARTGAQTTWGAARLAAQLGTLDSAAVGAGAALPGAPAGDARLDAAASGWRATRALMERSARVAAEAAALTDPAP